METEMVSLKLDKDMIQAVISKQIQHAIVQQLGNPEEYMEALIKNALHQKVDYKGKVSIYSSDNKYDYLDITLKEQVRTAVDEAIQEWIKEHKTVLKQQLSKHMQKEKVRDQFLNSFIDGFEKCFSTSYRLYCDIKFETPKE